jgi:cytochrome c5
MKSPFRIAILASLVSLVFVSYQNCGRVGFDAQRGFTSGMVGFGSAACEALLKQVYSRTYYPLLSNKCNRCHANAHGSVDLEVSYAGFMSKGVATIDYKATHSHGDNGLNLTNELGGLKPEWDQGQTDYLACMADAANQSASKLKVNSKLINAIEATKTDNSWKTVEWDLENEVPDKQVAMFPAFFKIEARYEMQAGAVAGINFRNPSLKLKATGKNLQITGMNIFLDTELQSSSTTFTGISSIVTTDTYTLLAPQNSVAFVSYPQFQPATLVAFEFVSLKYIDITEVPTTTMPATTLPAPTHTQLIGADPALNVFKSRCLSCHMGAAAPKGLDLSVYSMAAGASALINMRVNSAANPMPPTGQIPQAERDIISRWVNGGTPQ